MNFEDILQPAIVVITYNRLISLERLLMSLSKANYSGYENITLIISIDGGGTNEAYELAESFKWNFGNKRIIRHPSNLGLRAHVIRCGDLTNDYESILLLEDDLFLSPNFYDYSVQSLNFYINEPCIAGISLYSYRLNENIYLPFESLQDGNDTFFMQIPSSWGQLWSKKQWNSFKEFYNSNPIIANKDKLPSNVKNWPESSWKKYFYKYLVDYNLYLVYPQNSYSTNFGDAGQHIGSSLNFFQVPLVNGIGHTSYKFSSFRNSKIKYDAYFELLPECLSSYGVEMTGKTLIDLYGTKQLNLFDEDYIYSIKKCTNSIKSFDIKLHPLINNIIMNVKGDIVNLGRKQDFLDQSTSKTIILSAIDPYVFTYTEQYVKRTLPYKIGKYILHPKLLIKRLIKFRLIF